MIGDVATADAGAVTADAVAAGVAAVADAATADAVTADAATAGAAVVVGDAEVVVADDGDSDSFVSGDAVQNLHQILGYETVGVMAVAPNDGQNWIHARHPSRWGACSDGSLQNPLRTVDHHA